MSDIITKEEQEDLLQPLKFTAYNHVPEDPGAWPKLGDVIERAFRAGKRAGIKQGENDMENTFYDWIVAELYYPFDMSTDKPEWLDVRRLAQAWVRHDGTNAETVDVYIDTIYEETGWVRT